MLRELSVKNIAVIEELNMELKSGMCVLTGETGAGKSIIIDSINMVLGNKADKSLIRFGEEKAMVQAVFDVSSEVSDMLSKNDIDCDDNELIITRTMSSEGKSVCRLNGVVVPLSALKEIAPFLINIHGQQDNQMMLNPSKHILFLDSYAKADEILTEYKNIYSDYRSAQNELERLNIDDDERLRRLDLLKFQIKEIEDAKLSVGEEEELKIKRDKINNAEKITTSANMAYNLLYAGENGTAYENIYSAVSALENISAVDNTLDLTLKNLSDILYSIEDMAHEISDYMSNIEYDENTLNEIEERLDLYSKLKRKYGNDVAQIQEFLKKSQEEYELILSVEENTDTVKQKIVALEAKLYKYAKKLSDKRKKTALVLQAEIEKSLHELNMEQAKFLIHIDEKNDYSPDGKDDVEFLISANAGEPPKPLVKIASGGELSRVMLAMKAILADCDGVDTLIFDEIDTGVSGSAATKIASKLEEISKFKQVICITHLAQIAASADNHYFIEKNTIEGKTYTDVRLLAEDERVLEVARITAGDVTEISIKHAQELIQKVNDRKCKVQA